MTELTFQPWPKIARLNREIIVTEKIDGTNAAVIVAPFADLPDDIAMDGPPVTANGQGILVETDLGEFVVAAQSRKRIIAPGKQTDNFGFAGWVREHAQQLAEGLGEGHHFGEWYGRGIQRGYGLDERRFALFNTTRWEDDHPTCCEIVPVLYQGPFNEERISDSLEFLARNGSLCGADGFQAAEGVVVYHTAANTAFKVTLEGDESPKGAR